jgi:AcrR family transcriptional regulator
MSQIAETAGIGRATLYKYYPDLEAILDAWHKREIGAHFSQLEQARDGADGAAGRLEAVIRAFAEVTQESHGSHSADLVAFLHGKGRVAHAKGHLRDMVLYLIVDAAAAGAVRDDVPADELAGYCLSALAVARELPEATAVARLVDVILTGLRFRED